MNEFIIDFQIIWKQNYELRMQEQLEIYRKKKRKRIDKKSEFVKILCVNFYKILFDQKANFIIENKSLFRLKV